MRERQPGERLRVVIAGTIYSRRALVRRFLEDDGFSVLAEVVTRDQLVALDGLPGADAIVVDGDLLDRSVDELRALAPDAAIVVFTGSPSAAAAPLGADGYLEKGMGLASLTALLHSLLTETPAAPVALDAPEATPPAPRVRRVLNGLASAAAVVVMVAVVGLAVFGSGGVPVDRNVAEATQPPASPAAGATGSGATALRQARDDLQELEDAIRAGRTVEIGFVLDQLSGDLAALRGTGSLGAFGTSVTRLLQPLLGSLGSNLLDRIGGVLGTFLDLPSTDATTTGGSGGSGTDLLGGSTAGTITLETGTSSGSRDGGAGGSGSTGGDSGGSGGSGGGSGGSGGSGGGSGGSGGGGPTQGGGGTSNGGGNGHHYGWAHKPPQGGWHGEHPRGNGHAGGNARA